SCASVFNSDKGRFITPTDVANGYSEPFVQGGAESLRALDGRSLYPPRRDFVSCAGPSTVNVCMGGASTCQDHPDSASYAEQARAAMPEIDAITMATPPGDQPTTVMFDVPAAWPDGDYVAFLEINTEGDYNASYNDTVYPTPMSSNWDSWAMSYGYPFRGQPSVVFRLPIRVDGSAQIASTSDAFGYGSVSGVGAGGGSITPIDGTISNNAATAPGSGVDRLRLHPDGYRLRVEIGGTPPDAGVDADAAPDGPMDAADDAPAESDAGDAGGDGGDAAGGAVDARADAANAGADADAGGPRLAPRAGCNCSCDVGGGAGGPLGIALLVLVLVARRGRRGRG
ncbi:MAG TPA: hypothetical protein VN903_12380, partial [Polyangia bacterium]|nr:hypothetical protein [Polyangia bacterium]